MTEDEYKGIVRCVGCVRRLDTVQKEVWAIVTKVPKLIIFCDECYETLGKIMRG